MRPAQPLLQPDNPLSVLDEAADHPLITRENFTENKPQLRKWVLLPYRKEGKPLTAAAVHK
ncbi:MAG TPA: hypothetical protein ENF21_06575 [Bacteroidetes bacterium]|nr:hypothetical protein [Bacteroidota bacterium]